MFQTEQNIVDNSFFFIGPDPDFSIEIEIKIGQSQLVIIIQKLNQLFHGKLKIVPTYS